jgi:hypothetical protein
MDFEGVSAAAASNFWMRISSVLSVCGEDKVALTMHRINLQRKTKAKQHMIIIDWLGELDR